MRNLYLLLLFICFTFFGYGQTITSFTSGDWDQPGTWVGGVVPTSSNSTLVSIAATHAITIPNGFNATAVSVTIANNATSTLTIANGGTLSFTGILTTGGALGSNGRLIVNGTLIVQQGATMANTSTTKFTVGSTGIYRHNYTTTAGTIYNAGWTAGGQMQITGYTTNTATPVGLNQPFQNFVWDCPNQQTDIYLTGNVFSTINGNFSVINTGTNILGLDPSIDRTLNFNGSLLLSSDVFFDLNFNSTNTTINLVGDLTISSDDALAHQGSGVATIIFTGTSLKTLTSSSLLSTPVDFEISSSSTVFVPNGNFFSGPGNFLLHGTLRLGSTNSSGALLQDGSDGNIQMSGTISFSPLSTLVYAGTSAQFISNGHPSGTGINCEIDNSNGVTLSTNVTIGGNLTLTSGNVNVGARTLTLNGGFFPNSNFLNVQSTSSISIGGTGAFGTLRTTGSTAINNFTLNRVSGGTVTLGTDLNIGGTLTQTQGDIILNGRTFIISGPYSRTNGSFSVDVASSVIIDGIGSLPSEISFSGSQVLNTLTINRSSSTVGTSSSFTVTNLNLLSGIFNNTGTITMASNGVLTRTEGSIINNTPQASTSYDIIYNIATDISTGSEIPSLPNELRHLTKTGSATLALSQSIVINGNLTLSNGIFNAGLHSIDLKGNFIANSTSQLTNSSFTFSGATTISGGAIVQFGSINITGSLTPSVNIRIDGNLVNDGTLNAGTGAQTTTFGGITTISGSSSHNFNNITITGTLVAPSVLNIAGNFTFSSGTFTNSSGTVVFNGTSSVTGTPQFHNVTIAPGSTLSGPANLTLSGNFIANGTFNPGTGRITFNGTANQDLNRTVGTAGTVNLFDMTVNKSSGTLNVRGTIANTIFRLQNELTIVQAGISNPDIDFDGPLNTGTFVLASTSTRTARINAVPSGIQIIGNLTVERFVQNVDAVRAWRYFAPAVVGATVDDWLGEIQITGQFSNPSSGSGIPNPNAPSLYRWTETNGGTANNRYEVWPNNITLPASSFPLTNGRGYSAFVRNTGTPTITTRGTLRFGDVGISLSRTGSEVDAAGFNLIGNPYPAPIDWDLVGLPGGVSSIISMLDNVSNGGLGGGQFVYYAQGGPQVGDFDGIIASSQAFWVETSTNTTLTFTEAHKASAINPIIVRERQLANVLRINVEGNGRKDETVVYFRYDATDDYDFSFDARKRENTFINLFTYQVKEEGIEKFAINAMKNISCSREILIGLEKFEQGTYTFNFSGIESFDYPYTFTLVDNFTGSSVALTESIYVFQITENPLSNGNQRFKVIINEVGINSSLSVFGDEQCESSSASITINSTESNVSYQAYFNGVAIGQALIGTGGSVSLPLLGTFFEPGVYEIPVKAFNSCSEVFLDQKASLVIYEVPEATITSEGNTLYSNYTSGNQWYLNGVQLPGATNQQLEAQVSGLYMLSVTTPQGCITSSDIQFVVTSIEANNNSLIRIFPNPTQGKLRIEIDSDKLVLVRALDVTGKALVTSALTGSGSVKSGEIDLTNHADGVYILHIQKGDHVHQVKIIKTSK